MVIETDQTPKLLPLQPPIPEHPTATSYLQGQPQRCAVGHPARMEMLYPTLQPTASSPIQQLNSGVSIASGTKNQSPSNIHFLSVSKGVLLPWVWHFLGVAMVLRNK